RRSPVPPRTVRRASPAAPGPVPNRPPSPPGAGPTRPRRRGLPPHGLAAGFRWSDRSKPPPAPRGHLATMSGSSRPRLSPHPEAGSRYSAHTVLPGPSHRGHQPQRAASPATRSSPRPPTSSGPGARGSTLSGGVRSPRVSVTSTRTVPGHPGHLHPEVEVPAAHMTVPHGVGGQLADDHHDLLVRSRPVRDTPGVQPVRGQPAGETGTARGGGEPHLEGAARSIGRSRGPDG